MRPESETFLSDLLTSSRMKTARSCLHEHHLRYELGYREAENPDGFLDALGFGTIIHIGLEAWWKSCAAGEYGDAPLNAALAAMRAVKHKDAFAQVRAEVMLSGYHFRWLEDAKHYEVLGVEVFFKTELVNPESGVSSRTWRLAGKLDVLLRDKRDNGVRIMEHKTSSEDISLGSDYWKRLRMDGQVSTYFAGAASLGHRVAACIYDVLAKPTLKPFKATPVESRKYTNGRLYAKQHDKDETPDEYRVRLLEAYVAAPHDFYQRGEVVRLEQEVNDAAADAWALGRILRENQLAGRHPRNPDVCLRFGRRCPFFAACSGEASLDDPRFYTRTDNVHPELALASPGEQPAKEAGTA